MRATSAPSPSAAAWRPGCSCSAWPAANLFGALFAEQLTAVQAQTFYLFGDVFLYPAAMGAAVLVAATALVALRTAAAAVAPGRAWCSRCGC